MKGAIVFAWAVTPFVHALAPDVKGRANGDIANPGPTKQGVVDQPPNSIAQPPKPSPTSETRRAVLLPWTETPSRDMIRTNGCLQMATEDRCGTDIYCTSYLPEVGAKTDGKYSSRKECLDAHEPNPHEPTPPVQPDTPKPPGKATLLPWIEMPTGGKLKTNGCFDVATNELCGTWLYCVTYLPEMRGKRKNDGKYKSEKECLDAHEPNPHEPKPPVQPDTPKPPGQATPLPWIDQPTRDEVKASGCFEIATDERCGTELYCNTYDPKIGGKNDGKYSSTKECLDAHELNPHDPKPSAQPAPPTPKPPVQPEPHMPKPSGQAALLPWIDQPTRDEVKASGCFEMATDERCGTELYCNTYDPKIGGKNDGKYSSTKECLDAHKPEPRKPN
ncbi:hypothetical protein PCL_06591 [Purpureocillium lilacinum]|uniref:Uncharacterized protein n=1 Tax=Purpureocillium lilacinum TaxID=33203 RepID=A0A2U3EN51_PURLI|nr:hypothetical protein PCL_06591 [Purpureocillium lilacinum]